MSKLNLSNFAKNISAKLGANAPGITIGLGTGAILVAGVMVGVATPKAMKLIEDAQVAKTKRFEQMREKAPDDAVMDETDELTWVEIIKAGWKPYAPAIMTAVVGVACIVGGTRANARRNAALSAAYTVVEQTLNDYTAKTKEIVGEKKEKEIRDAIAEDELKKHPLSGCNVVRMPKCGKTLCYDVRSREYFMSDYNTIKKVENDLNRRLRSEMFISLNEVYDEFGIVHDDELGDDIGWNVDNELEFTISSKIAENNEPCLVVNYVIAPRYDFRNLH